jgi:hypothetical protein
MEKKEHIEDFNQRFTTILNKFSVDAQPIKGVVVEYYASALHASIAMYFG